MQCTAQQDLYYPFFICDDHQNPLVGRAEDVTISFAIDDYGFIDFPGAVLEFEYGWYGVIVPGRHVGGNWPIRVNAQIEDESMAWRDMIQVEGDLDFIPEPLSTDDDSDEKEENPEPDTPTESISDNLLTDAWQWHDGGNGGVIKSHSATDVTVLTRSKKKQAQQLFQVFRPFEAGRYRITMRFNGTATDAYVDVIKHTYDYSNLGVQIARWKLNPGQTLNVDVELSATDAARLRILFYEPVPNQEQKFSEMALVKLG